jgi:hypothetical protein
VHQPVASSVRFGLPATFAIHSTDGVDSLEGKTVAYLQQSVLAVEAVGATFCHRARREGFHFGVRCKWEFANAVEIQKEFIRNSKGIRKVECVDRAPYSSASR